MRFVARGVVRVLPSGREVGHGPGGPPNSTVGLRKVPRRESLKTDTLA